MRSTILVRRLWLALVVLLIPAAARADDHKADVSGGLSFASGSTLTGFRVSGAEVLRGYSRHLSAAGDFAIHWGTHEGRDVTLSTFMGGFRWTQGLGARGQSTRKEPYTPTTERERHAVFGQALVGVVHRTNGGGTDPALALGGGWEYLLEPRAYPKGWIIRVQGEYVISSDGFPRLTAGLGYRFK